MRIGNSEIFILSAEANVEGIVYSPLNNKCFFVDSFEAEQIVSCLSEKKKSSEERINLLIEELTDYRIPVAEEYLKQSPYDYTTLSLLPNQICNFHCTYCYSAKGRSNKIIDKAKLYRALDFFIDDKRLSPQTLKLFISGGGEPLLTWEDTRRALVYAHERAGQYGFTLGASIISNGTMINDDIIHTLKKYKSSICISFEVLKEVQNSLRGNYKKVSENLIQYGKSGIPTMINSTITPQSVNRMKEMAKEVFTKYPFVKSYTLEPVTDYTLFSSPAAMRAFYKIFTENYVEIKERYNETRTEIWCTLEELSTVPRLRYCPGKLCLTAEGTFTVCHCASSSQEERYEKCKYGTVDENGVSFDMDKFRQLIDINGLNKEKCRDCFAKWNCGGECMTRQDQYPEEYMDEVCNFNRQWLLMQLENKLKNDKKDGSSIEK
jgi:radical SAM protein with 4Fe4S-binding SPASM domain